MTEAQQYRIVHRGGVTGRAWKVLGLGWIDDRDQAHHRADRRRKDAPEEQVKVQVRTVTYTPWKDEP